MMGYLNEVENFVTGSEMGKLRQMIGTGKEHIGLHVNGYDKLANDIKLMNEEAIDAIKLASKYDKGASKVAREYQEAQNRLKSQLVEIKEDKAAEDQITSP